MSITSIEPLLSIAIKLECPTLPPLIPIAVDTFSGSDPQKCTLPLVGSGGCRGTGRPPSLVLLSLHYIGRPGQASIANRIWEDTRQLRPLADLSLISQLCSRNPHVGILVPVSIEVDDATKMTAMSYY